MHYLLILLFSSVPGHTSSAAYSIEFNNKLACEKAAADIIKMELKEQESITAFCEPQGE